MQKNQQVNSTAQKSSKLEHSKLLTYIDVIAWMLISIALLAILLNKPELGVFVQNIFAYSTTAYVSLRLGYTAKAGVENYQKIHNSYKEIIPEKEENDDSNG